MIINTGQRTDIPAFYPEWFANRLREGIVCVRNPFNHQQVSRYRLDPEVVDLICFCTKNPTPLFPHMDLLADYGQFWFMTITPYGRDIEPNVPGKHQMLSAFQELSGRVGKNRVCWRYDPIFLSERYTKEYHLKAFRQMAEALDGYTEAVVISFIDLYEKVKRNFPEVRSVKKEDRLELGQAIIEIAAAHGMTVRPCAEGDELAPYGADCSGCGTIAVYEKALGQRLVVPAFKPSRAECACYISCDIGAYDTCRHFCRYCYANNDVKMVAENGRRHDPRSPFLIGNYEEDDIVHDVPQKSWIDPQISLFD